MSQLRLGEVVEYHSSSHNSWLECTITHVQSGEVQISIKPGYWFSVQEQRSKLRVPPSAQKQAQLVNVGRSKDDGAANKNKSHGQEPGKDLVLVVGSDEIRLPNKTMLDDDNADVREVFFALRGWLKGHHRSGNLAAVGQSLDIEHRKSVFRFLCSIPSRKSLLQNQSRELLKMVGDLPSWRHGNAIDDATFHNAVTPPPPKQRAASPPEGLLNFQPQPRDRDHTEDDVPPPPPPPEEEEDIVADIFSGMPPPEAFAEGSRHDAGDTFKELRKWARRLPVWDLCAAGVQLPADVRRSIFQFLTRISKRKLYSSQAQEMFRMLLSVEEWTNDNVVDSSALDALEEEHHPVKPCAPSPPPPRGPAVSPEPKPAQRQESEPPPPPPGAAPRAASAGPPKPEQPKRASRGQGLRARVEAALAGGMAISDGQQLVRLYKESGLGGEAQLSAKACNAQALGVMLAITGQRLKDIFIDDLQARALRAPVHFPHLYINLHKKSVTPMSRDIQMNVEQKISRGQTLTSVEKAHVLTARHEQTIIYVLSYGLMQAQKAGRSAVWINMGMDTGAQGHANAVILQALDGRGSFQVLIYDPNFNPEQSHYVHAKKAINDQLPKVQRLVKGLGINVQQAELFGHGLQTALGTTSQHRGLLSRAVVTTQQGYPICGSVVHLLAVTWLSVMRTDSGHAVLEDVVAVEAALADLVLEPNGKTHIQQKIAAILRGLDERFASGGADPFGTSMKQRLDRDRRSWPKDFTDGGGNIDMSIAKGRRSYSYKF